MPTLLEIGVFLLAIGCFALALSSGLRAFARSVVVRSTDTAAPIRIWTSVFVLAAFFIAIVVTVAVTLALSHC